jgi:cobalt/nickel transport system permease protein
MLNIAIPGTGASGHMIGGLFLAALLGPWSAFLVLSVVLILQCLLLGDGGLLALGCNILNMAACSCLVVYPLVFKPLMRYPASLKRLFGVSILAGVVAMELSALLLSLEMIVSGVAPLRAYLLLVFMLSIHLIIGVLEGCMTALLLYFVQQQRPGLLQTGEDRYARSGWVVLSLVLVTLLIAFVVRLFTSSQPDGMEWSVERALAAPWSL